MIDIYGEDKGRALLQFAATTADCAFDLIAKYRMNVPLARKGWIQAAHSADGLALAQSRVRQWSKHGVDARLLGRDEMVHCLGTQSYQGGWMDPRGGAVQPLSYAREMARIAIQLGARIHGQSPVVSLSKQGERFCVTTDSGQQVLARKVVTLLLRSKLACAKKIQRRVAKPPAPS